MRWWLLPALAAALVHLASLRSGFALDDVRLVETNPDIVSIAGVPKLFAQPYWNVEGEHYGLYRPLTTASYALNRAVTGPAPFGFHLINVLLHAAVAALAWLALREAGTRYGTALMGSLLFAVLPIHTEAVANVAGRAELLAAAFVLAGWIAHRHGRIGLAAAFYLAAILSKESAILAPALFLADDALRGDRARWTRLGAYAAAAVVMIALRANALGAHQAAEATIALDNPAAAAGTWPRIATALWVQVKYAWLCIVPTTLVSDYSLDAIPVARSIVDPRCIAGVLFVAGLATAAWRFRASRPVVLAILAWAVFFLPSANLLFPAGTVMAERLAYLPSLGLCLLAGHLGAGLASHARLRVAAWIALFLVLGIDSGRTLARVPDWKDNLTLALVDVAESPRSAKLQAGAGMFLAKAGRNAEAEDHLRRAVEIYPDYAQMHYNLAVLLARRGARDEAIDHLRRAIAIAPGNPLPEQLLNELRR